MTAPAAIARPNGNNGIGILSSASNLIGGAEPAQRNVISGNRQAGVFIGNGPSQGNRVEGNYIGTNAGGTSAVGNLTDGVLISAQAVISTYASMNRVGGADPGQGNLLSGNGWSGVDVFRGTQNEILGNLIGTKADGASPLPNLNDGVLLYEASDNVVGGQFADDGSGAVTIIKRNVISGNDWSGVEILANQRPACCPLRQRGGFDHRA